MHAAKIKEILEERGVVAETVTRVQALVRKDNLRRDAEALTLEDVACLQFLRFTLPGFAARHPAHKVQGYFGQNLEKDEPRST